MKKQINAHSLANMTSHVKTTRNKWILFSTEEAHKG